MSRKIEKIIDKTSLISASVFLIGVLSSIATIPIIIIKEGSYEHEIGHHVKNGFNGISTDQIYYELNEAVKLLESKGLTSGCTDMFYCSSEGDIGFWYRTIKASRDEAKLNLHKTSYMPYTDENSLLYRYREVMENTYGEDYSPSNIGYYPNYIIYGFWFGFNPIMISLGLILYGLRRFYLNDTGQNDYVNFIFKDNW